MYRITKQEGNKIWINTQVGFGYENDMLIGALNEPRNEWYGKIKFIYLTVYNDCLNGQYCGYKRKYRISKSGKILDKN